MKAKAELSAARLSVEGIPAHTEPPSKGHDLQIQEFKEISVQSLADH